MADEKTSAEKPEKDADEAASKAPVDKRKTRDMEPRPGRGGYVTR